MRKSPRLIKPAKKMKACRRLAKIRIGFVKLKAAGIF
jgi:hypothetical protein